MLVTDNTPGAERIVVIRKSDHKQVGMVQWINTVTRRLTWLRLKPGLEPADGATTKRSIEDYEEIEESLDEFVVTGLPYPEEPRPHRLQGGAKFLLDTGLLGEINRLVLHPRGMALAVNIAEDGTTTFSDELFDHRDDPEGMIMSQVLLKDIQEKLKTAPTLCPKRMEMFPPDGIEPLH
jgi:hypothetical protein